MTKVYVVAWIDYTEGDDPKFYGAWPTRELAEAQANTIGDVHVFEVPFEPSEENETH